jgi:O-antigen ligase
LSPHLLVSCLVTFALVLGLALAFLPLRAILLALGAALAVGLALVDPIFGVYWAILSVPAQEIAHLPGGLSYTQAAMLLAAGAWGLRVLAHPERRIVPEGRRAAPQLVLWAVFLWFLLLSAALSPFSRAEGIKETLRWAEAFAIWLMVVSLARRRWHVVGLIACLLLAPAAEAALGLWQFATGAGPPSFRVSPDLPFVRAYGTIGQPNSFAGYLNMAWPLALALAAGATWQWIGTLRRAKTDDQRPKTKDRRPKTEDQRPKTEDEKTEDQRPKTEDEKTKGRAGRLVLGPWSLALGLATVLLLAALVASLSRGAWVGAATGVLGMLLALGVTLGRRARAWLLGAAGVAALALALGGAGLLPAFVEARLSSITRYLAIFDAGTAPVTPENFAVVERMSQMQAGWRMFLEHPLLGVGPGNYGVAYPQFAVGSWYISRGHAHNYYLHLAAETGLAGLAAYLALLAGLALRARAILRRANSTFFHSAAVGCCGIIAAVVGHDLFENLHVLSMGVQLAGVWGLLFAIEDISGTKTS